MDGGILSKEHGQQGTCGPGIEARLEQPGFGCVCGGVLADRSRPSQYLPELSRIPSPIKSTKRWRSVSTPGTSLFIPAALKISLHQARASRLASAVSLSPSQALPHRPTGVCNKSAHKQAPSP